MQDVPLRFFFMLNKLNSIYCMHRKKCLDHLNIICSRCKFIRHCHSRHNICSPIWGQSLSCGYQPPNTGGLSAAGWSYLPSSVHLQAIMCFETQAVKHTETNERALPNANPLVHIRHTIFPLLFLLRFSKWMIKSTMQSSIQVFRNACLLPAAGQRARRKQSHWWRAAHLLL